MNAIEKIEEKLNRGETILGTHTLSGGAVTAEIYGRIGYDALWIDMEHGPMTKPDALNAIIAACGTGMASFVRIAKNDPVLAKPILEMGCDGIIFPMVCTPEEAAVAVSACRYPPYGVRGFGPHRATMYGLDDSAEYVRNQSRKVWTIIQIEDIRAVENLDEILKVDGVDLYIVGSCDLSASMGLLPDTNHPEVKKVLDLIAGKMKSAGKRFGVGIGYTEEAVRDWVRRGADFIFSDNEFNYIARGAAEMLGNLRRFI